MTGAVYQNGVVFGEDQILIWVAPDIPTSRVRLVHVRIVTHPPTDTADNTPTMTIDMPFPPHQAGLQRAPYLRFRKTVVRHGSSLPHASGLHG